MTGSARGERETDALCGAPGESAYLDLVKKLLRYRVKILVLGAILLVALLIAGGYAMGLPWLGYAEAPLFALTLWALYRQNLRATARQAKQPPQP